METSLFPFVILSPVLLLCRRVHAPTDFASLLLVQPSSPQSQEPFCLVDCDDFCPPAELTEAFRPACANKLQNVYCEPSSHNLTHCTRESGTPEECPCPRPADRLFRIAQDLTEANPTRKITVMCPVGDACSGQTFLSRGGSFEFLCLGEKSCNGLTVLTEGAESSIHMKCGVRSEGGSANTPERGLCVMCCHRFAYLMFFLRLCLLCLHTVAWA